MKRIVSALLITTVAIGLIGCSASKTTDQADVPTVKPTEIPKEKPTETPTPTPQPKSVEDVIYDCVSVEDDMTGVKQYYSQYNYYLDDSGHVIPITYYKDLYVYAPFWFALIQDGDSLQYLVNLRYMDDDWIFFDKLLVKTDDNDTHTIDLRALTPNRDVSSGTVWETYTFTPGAEERKVFEEIANAKSCTMRFQGDKGKYQFELGPEEIKAVKHTVEMYNDYYS